MAKPAATRPTTEAAAPLTEAKALAPEDPPEDPPEELEELAVLEGELPEEDVLLPEEPEEDDDPPAAEEEEPPEAEEEAEAPRQLVEPELTVT